MDLYDLDLYKEIDTNQLYCNFVTFNVFHCSGFIKSFWVKGTNAKLCHSENLKLFWTFLVYIVNQSYVGQWQSQQMPYFTVVMWQNVGHEYFASKFLICRTSCSAYFQQLIKIQFSPEILFPRGTGCGPGWFWIFRLCSKPVDPSKNAPTAPVSTPSVPWQESKWMWEGLI